MRETNLRIAIYVFSAVSYLTLCLSLVAADALLGSQEFRELRHLIVRLADWLLLLFPNSFFSLLYGVTSSFVASLGIVAVIHALFFYVLANWLVKHRSRKIVVSMCAVYIALSGASYVLSNYLFFKFYFMQPRGLEDSSLKSD